MMKSQIFFIGLDQEIGNVYSIGLKGLTHLFLKSNRLYLIKIVLFILDTVLSPHFSWNWTDRSQTHTSKLLATAAPLHLIMHV